MTTDALSHFKKADPALYNAAKRHAADLSRIKPKRGADRLFEALISSIVSQQLATSAARAIWKRVKDACGAPITPDVILRMRPAKLGRAGLSGAKIKAMKSVAKAMKSGKLDLPSLRRLPEEEAAAQLTALWGIGPWTAEMFLMFALGHPDVFSAGDLGLVRAMEALYGLPRGVPRETLLAISAPWSPHRTHASLVLWKLWDDKKLTASGAQAVKATRSTKLASTKAG